MMSLAVGTGAANVIADDISSNTRKNQGNLARFRQLFRARLVRLVLLPWDDLKGRTWRICDIFTPNEHERSGDVIRTQGLYVDLVPGAIMS